MIPTLEYASSIWSPLASSTIINKLQVMQNAALRTVTGCPHKTHTYNICMTKHSYFPYTITYSSTHHNTKTPLTQTLQGENFFNSGRYTTNIPTDPHTITTTDIKTNM